MEATDGSESDTEIPYSPLRDAIHVVFKYLEFRSLSRAAVVCKEWHRAAKIELKKRSIQVLPTDSDYRDCIKRIDVNRFLRFKPEWILVFHDDTPVEREESFREICTSFFLPGRPWSIETLGCGINERNLEMVNYERLGLCFADSRSVQIKIFEEKLEEMKCWTDSKFNSVIAEIADGLIEGAETRNAALMMLTPHWQNFRELEIEEEMVAKRNRFTENILKKLGKHLSELAICGGHVEWVTGRYDYWFSAFLYVKLSGPNLKAYSFSISIHSSSLEAKDKMRQVKESMEKRKSRLALAFVPSKHNERVEERLAKTRDFREVFPDTDLNIVYLTDRAPIWSMDSLESNSKIKVSNEIIAYLLVNYN